MVSPTSNHLLAVKCIFRYLQGTIHQGLAFTLGPLTFFAYSDANWAGDPMDMKSISGILVFLGNSPITWFAKKQPTVSRSFTEAEYMALASCAVELCWICMLLKDLLRFFILLLLYGVIISLHWLLLVILCFMLGLSILKWITTLFVRRFSVMIFKLSLFLLMINWLTFSPRVYLLLGFIGLFPSLCGASP